MECWRRIGEAHYGDAALIPGLHFDIAARDGNQRAVMRHAVFRVTLRGWQLVIVGETQLAVLQAEDRVRAPLVRVVRTATRSQAAAPLIGEYDFASVVRERSRVPVRIVRSVDRIHPLRLYGVLYVEQDAISCARARRQTNRRVHGDVVALIRVLRLLHALFAFGVAVIHASYHALPA